MTGRFEMFPDSRIAELEAKLKLRDDENDQVHRDYYAAVAERDALKTELAHVKEEYTDLWNKLAAQTGGQAVSEDRPVFQPTDEDLVSRIVRLEAERDALAAQTAEYQRRMDDVAALDELLSWLMQMMLALHPKDPEYFARFDNLSAIVKKVRAMQDARAAREGT